MSKLVSVKDYDADFAHRRAESRRKDLLAVSTNKATPEEIQRKNSILPRNFWSKAKIDWATFTVGKKSHS